MTELEAEAELEHWRAMQALAGCVPSPRPRRYVLGATLAERLSGKGAARWMRVFRAVEQESCGSGEEPGSVAGR